MVWQSTTAITVSTREPHSSGWSGHNINDHCLVPLARALTTVNVTMSPVQMAEFFPEQSEKLSEYIESLPSNFVSPVAPFSGYILNLNCVTRIHRDTGDADICLVVPFSDADERDDQTPYNDGALCFYELGLVIKLRSGTPIIFRSRNLTHFNHHFKGYRASLVFHSDQGLDGWISDRYGWKDNVNLRLAWSNT